MESHEADAADQGVRQVFQLGLLDPLVCDDGHDEAHLRPASIRECLGHALDVDLESFRCEHTFSDPGALLGLVAAPPGPHDQRFTHGFPPGGIHFHCCVIDGVFTAGKNGQVHFADAAALTPEDLAAVRQARSTVLRWFACPGCLDPADGRDMAGWHHHGLLPEASCVLRERVTRRATSRQQPDSAKTVLIVIAFTVDLGVSSANCDARTPSLFLGVCTTI
jgi:hypothetical protein